MRGAPTVEQTAEQEVAQHLIEGLRAQIGPSVRLRGIEVEVGVTVDLNHAALMTALSAGLPGIEVRIRAVAVLFQCADCGAEFPADEHPCPVCGSARVSLVHGEELGIARAWAESA
jgi:Zn finger protein HypA/HybF involved in hydrogenase expression